jgi:ABC-type bacteriocin/lantibiotic exporter with double-glycine peptidase domain
MLAAAQVLGDVEPYQQTEKYSCGAATLKAVLQHWNERVPEKKLIKEIGIDPKTGSTALQVASAARKRGYRAVTQQFNSIAELGKVTAQDIPVIIAIRSFTRPNQGHFVVATKVTPTMVEMMDPNVKGNRRSVSHRELDSRWRFRDRVGVIVTPVNRNAQLGTTSTANHKIAYAVAGAVALVAAVTTGVVLWRRKHAS